MTDHTLLILNGPGLSDLRVGDDRYGHISLQQIQDECAALCCELGIRLEFRQTDDEDEIVRWITQDGKNCGALIINPVGYASAHAVDLDKYRSSIEAIAHVNKPVIEVHLTNIFREGAEITKPIQGPAGAMGFVCGLGKHSYLLAIKAVAQQLGN